MKASIIVLLASLSGCVTYSQSNASPEQRALAMQYLMGHQNPVQLYQLPTPQQYQRTTQQTYLCVRNYGSGPVTVTCSQ